MKHESTLNRLWKTLWPITLASIFYVLITGEALSAVQFNSSDIKIDNAPLSAKAEHPAMTADDSGNVYITWLDDRDGTEHIYFNKSSDGGQTFEASDIRIDTGSDKGNHPQIFSTGDKDDPNVIYNGHMVNDQKYIFITWVDTRNGRTDIFFNMSSDHGATWLPTEKKINNGDGISTVDHPFIAADSEGRVWIIWQDTRNGTTDLFLNISTDFGATWNSTDRQINSNMSQINPTFSANHSMLNYTNGIIHMFWVDNRTGKDQIYMNHSMDFGITWMPHDHRVSTGNGNTRNFDICHGENGMIYVAWEDDRDGDNGIFINYSIDHGMTWESSDLRVDDTPGPHYSIQPRMAEDYSGTIFVAWQDRPADGKYDVYFRDTDEMLSSWGAIKRIDTSTPVGSSNSNLIRMHANHDGTVSIVWQDDRNGLSDIYLNHSDDLGVTFLDDEIMVNQNAPGTAASINPMLMVKSNNLYILWEDNRGTNNPGAIYFNYADHMQADVEPPVTTPDHDAGTYGTTITVTLTSIDAIDASPEIYYTTDGSTPTVSAPNLYSSPISISSNTTLKFFGVDDAGNQESVQTFTYIIDPTYPVTTASLASGTYSSSQSVTLITTLGGIIYYTTDGTEPTTGSTVYSGALSITSTTTLKFFAVANNNSENVEQRTYIIDSTAPVTTASPSSRLLSMGIHVILTADEAAAIYYTTNGTTPTVTSSLYINSIAITQTTTLKFFAKDTAGNIETVKTEIYTMDTTMPTSSASPSGQSFTGSIEVTLTASESGIIYYTTDGLEPTVASAQYSSALTFTGNTTLKFFTFDDAGNCEMVTNTEIYLLDSDSDGNSDNWEDTYFPGPGSVGTEDPDSDGLDNIGEELAGTDPNDADSDNDTMSDGWEVANALNPLSDDSMFDPDLDGYTNLQEYSANTDPHDAASCPAKLNINLGVDMRIDLGDPAGNAESKDPQMIADNSGHIYAVWEDKRNGKKDIYFNRSLDYGATWLASAVRLDLGDAPGAEDSDHPHITITWKEGVDGNQDDKPYIYVIWEDHKGSKRDIYLNYSYDYGTTWLASAKKISNFKKHSKVSKPSVAADQNGNVYAVWEEKKNDKVNIMTNNSSDYGVTWGSTDIQINRPDSSIKQHYSAEKPVAAFINGVIHVVWTDDRDGKENIYLNHSMDGGATWMTNDHRVSHGTGHSTKPDIYHASGGKLFIVWEDDRNQGHDIYLNYSNDHGMTWQGMDTRVTNHGHVHHARNPVVTGDEQNNKLYIAFEDHFSEANDHEHDKEHDDKGHNIYIAVSDDFGISWEEDKLQQVNDRAHNQGKAHEPRISANSNGDVYVAWVDKHKHSGGNDGHENDGSKHVFLTYSSDYGATWPNGEYKVDQSTSRHSKEPVLFVDDTENIYIVWEDNRDGKYDIYFNSSAIAQTNDTTPPVSQAIPVGGTYGANLTVELSATDDVDQFPKIYYSTDGSTPTTLSPQYSTPISVNSSMTIKFFARDNSDNEEPYNTEVYTIDANIPTTTASPAGGIYAAAQLVTLTTDEPAVIYYSTDGSTPTTGSTSGTSPIIDIPINQDTTLKFFAVDNADNTEPVKTEIYTIDTTPPITTANPVGGIFGETLNVILIVNEEATTYYTTDGTTPSTDVLNTTTSYYIGGDIPIPGDTTLKFFSIDLAGNQETIKTEVYIMDDEPPVTTASPTGGSFTTAQSVTLSTTDTHDPNPTIYYTTDGTDPIPGAGNTYIYTAPISITSTTTLMFYAVDASFNLEATNTEVYILDTVTPVTTANPAGGTYNSTQNVTLTADEPATIFYTTDGAAPSDNPIISPTTISGTSPISGIVIATDTTLKFFAKDTAGNMETEKLEIYVIDTTPPVTTMSPGEGSYAAGTYEFTLTADEPATIYYTTDGSIPTTSSTQYSVPFSISSTTTVKFFAVDTAGNIEIIQSKLIIINSTPPSTTANPTTGLYNANLSVTLTAVDDYTANPTIYYTTDGTTPTTSSTSGTSPLTLPAINSTTDVKFFAVDSVGNTEAVNTETYVIDDTPPITTADPTGGWFNGPIHIKLTPNEAAVTYYTTDGNEPYTIVDGFITIAPTALICVFDIYLQTEETTSLKFFSIDTAGNVEAVKTELYNIDISPPVTGINPTPGLYNTLDLTLTLSSNDVISTNPPTIYYTTDGTIPTTSSTSITLNDGVTTSDSFNITTTTTIKYFAVDSFGNEEIVETAVYTLQEAYAELTYPPETGYSFYTGVSPDQGILTQTITYKVIFTDAIGDPPDYMYVFVDAVQQTLTTPDTSLPALDPLRDGDYTNGEQYVYTTTALASGNHDYYFKSNVRNNATPTILPETGLLQGPYINSKPVMSYYDNAPAGYSDSDGIEPNNGPVGTNFDYKVWVTDDDDTFAELTVKVYIDNDTTGNIMTPGSPLFSYTKTGVGLGNHTYYFDVTDGKNTVRLPSTGVLNNHLVNDLPTLSDSAETGFNGDAVEPNSGPSTTNFVFKIIYSDPNNTAPDYVKLHINSEEVLMELDEAAASNDGSFINGEQYTVTKQLPIPADMSSIAYVHYFTTSDGLSTSTTGTDPAYSGPTVINTGPELTYSGDSGYTSDGVNPNSGQIDTNFTYKVVYTDIDNHAPSATNLVKVYIDGTANTMILDPSAGNDGDYTNGEQYKYTTTIPEGPHTYYFSTSDGTVATNLPSAGASGPDAGPQVNYIPVITYSAETGYDSADGVNPDSGIEGTTFLYKFVYTDLDNDPPHISGPLTLYINGAAKSLTLDSTALDTLRDGRYDNGEQYTYNTSTLTPGTYTYYTDVSDGQNSYRLPALTDSPNTKSGPIVNNPPIVAYTGATNYTTDAVNPNNGIKSTTFTYKVKYTDYDDTAPQYVRLYIDSKPYVNMQRESSTTNYSTGETYVYSTKLPEGGHEYYVQVSDGLETDRLPATGTDPHPTVNAAPLLSSSPETGYDDGVSPNSGTAITDFTYKLIYTDDDDDAPFYIRLHIDGNTAGVDMIADTSPPTAGLNDGNYTNGEQYTYTTKLSSTSHNFYFSTNDGYQIVRYPQAGNISGPIVNNKPILSYSPDSGYITDGIQPNSSNLPTSITYKIIYTDADNQAPVNGVKLFIDNVENTMSLDPSAGNDGDYTNGEQYKFSMTIGNGNHTYSFEATDGTETGLLPSTGSFSGPAINTPPTLSPSTETGYTTDGVNPDTGTVNDNFTFKVIYTDPNNDTPYYINLYVADGTSMTGNENPITLTIDNSAADPTLRNGDFTDGEQYSITTTLSPGPHVHAFKARDNISQTVSELNYAGPTLDNSLPTLSYSVESAFSDGVNPNSSAATVNYKYKVVYTDAENTPPVSIEVYIVGLGNYTMSKDSGQDNDYTNGEQYFFTISGITLTGGNHYFAFIASDRSDGTEVRMPPSGSIPGPTVNHVPTLSLPPVEELNYNDGIDPNSSTISSTFVYKVVYTDASAPEYVRLYVDDSTTTYYEMIRDTAALTPELKDLNFINGEQYVVTGPLLSHRAAGHNFLFSTSDFMDSSLLGLISGPVINMPPVLSLSLETGYSDDANPDGVGVRNPDDGTNSGTMTTNFVFKVVYEDSDNDAPSEAVVRINGAAYVMSRDTSTSTGTLKDSTYSNKEQYIYTTQLSPGTHQHVFEFTDGVETAYLPGQAATYAAPTVDNDAPSLSNGGVSPSIGSSTSLYTFSVTYSDPNGQEPEYVRVKIDGIWYDLTPSAGGSYLTGKVYTYTTESGDLSAGSHSYEFLASDSLATASISSTSITINTPPVFSFSSDTGYVNDGVDPDSGNPQSITYKIVVTDINGAISAVKVHIDNDSIGYLMSQDTGCGAGLCDTSILNGEQYTYTIALGAGNHNYYFTANDSYDVTTSATYTEPVLNTSPVLSYSTETGFNNGFDPDTGISSTLITYKVIYTDADNNAPAFMKTVIPSLPIGNQEHAMSIDNSAIPSLRNGDFTDGEQYYYTRYFTPGSYDVYFSTSDWLLSDRLPASGSNSGPVIDNTAPTLSYSTETGFIQGLDKQNAKVNENVTYKVVFSDPDNLPPANVYVYINGTAKTMLKDTSASGTVNDNNYLNGEQYYYTTNFTAIGTHKYYFEASDANSATVQLPVPPGNDGPTITNDKPVLSRAVGANYGGDTSYQPAGDDVHPNNGSTGTTFAFKIIYTDLNNQPPADIRIHINDDPTGTPLIKDPTAGNDDNYADGEQYQLTTMLNPVGTYTYYFTTTDGIDSDRLPAVSNIPLPNVINTIPVLAFSAESGYGSDGVSPDNGTDLTNFTYKIIFIDQDNNAPTGAGYIKVYINGTGYPMVLDTSPGTSQDLKDGDHTVQGEQYKYTTTLGIGSVHQYYFEAFDGSAVVRVPVLTDVPNYLSGPVVVDDAPTLSLSGISGFGDENDGVEPDSGTTAPMSTTYRIKYTHPAGDPPSYLKLHIDAIPGDGDPGILMTVVSGSPDYTAGEEFYHTMDVGHGAHTYYFETSTNSKIARYPYIVVISADALQGPVINNAPALSPSATPVFPTTGLSTETYVFKVVYTDQDDMAPSYVTAYINATAKTMTRVSGSAADYAAGEEYQTASISLPVGSAHTYSFKASDGIVIVTEPGGTGPTVNNTAPVLTPAGIAGYLDTTDGVEPNSGTTTTNFVLKIKYSDADNEAPSYINAIIDGTAYSMTTTDTDPYSTGRVYSTGLLNLSEGSHTYYFTTSDATDTDTTSTLNNLTVNYIPSLSYSLDAGYDASDGVSPDTGNASTLFTYKVIYIDQDNNQSSTVQLIIDTNPAVTMSADTLASAILKDGDYSNGEQFTYSTTLPFGDHTYQFVAFDTVETATLSNSGPILNTKPVLSYLPDTGSQKPQRGKPNPYGSNDEQDNDRDEIKRFAIGPYGPNDGVDPDSAVGTAAFTYKVIYTDADNEAPYNLMVNIDGLGNLMGPDTSLTEGDPLRDGVYTNGEQYTLTITFTGGSHTYYFNVSDGPSGLSDRLPPSGSLSGPVIDALPTLKYSSEAGFNDNTGVKPMLATLSSTFTYKIIYTDSEGDIGLLDGQPDIKLYIDQSPIGYLMNVESSVNSAANLKDGDYTNGEQFVFFTDTNALGIGTHSYHIIASDGTQSIRFPASGEILAPHYCNTLTGDSSTIVTTDATITFDHVDSAGDTTVVQVTESDIPQAPANFSVGEDSLYEVNTTAEFSGFATICFSYLDENLSGLEEDLKILHYKNGGWLNVTYSLDMENNIICGKVTSFSPIILATRDKPTSVDLISFYSMPRDKEIVISWISGIELDTEGFNILRSEDPEGPFLRINSKMITSKGSTFNGAEYTYVDRNLKNGKRYYYKLQDIDSNGSKKEHFVISSIPHSLFDEEHMENMAENGSVKTAETKRTLQLGETFNGKLEFYFIEIPESIKEKTDLDGQLTIDDGDIYGQIEVKLLQSSSDYTIIWKTTREFDNFNILRSESEEGGYQLLNEIPISIPRGIVSPDKSYKTVYKYKDTDLVPGRQYFYKLEFSDEDGILRNYTIRGNRFTKTVAKNRITQSNNL